MRFFRTSFFDPDACLHLPLGLEAGVNPNDWRWCQIGIRSSCPFRKLLYLGGQKDGFGFVVLEAIEGTDELAEGSLQRS